MSKLKYNKGSFCYMIFAAPGTGKTTYAAKIASDCLNSKRHKRCVFSNFPLRGSYRIDDPDSVGKFDYGNSICLIDEAGISYNNRDYKHFNRDTMEYLKLHRHYGTSFVFFSQGWDDCDKKIRTLCTRYFNLKKVGPFTFIREIKKVVGIDETTKQIIDEYRKVPFFFGGLRIFFRPRYYKMFDSYDCPPLDHSPLSLWTPGSSNLIPKFSHSEISDKEISEMIDDNSKSFSDLMKKRNL